MRPFIEKNQPHIVTSKFHIGANCKQALRHSRVEVTAYTLIFSLLCNNTGMKQKIGKLRQRQPINRQSKILDTYHATNFFATHKLHNYI